MDHAEVTRPGGGALGAVDRAMYGLEKFTALVSGFGIFGLMLIGVAQIFGRKFFNAPIFGYIDIVEIIHVGAGVPGARLHRAPRRPHPHGARSSRISRGAGCGRSS